MTDVSWVFVAVAFLVAMAVLFVIATAIRSWVFELTPKEWGYTVVLTAAVSAFVVAYLDGDGLIELLSGGLIALAILWWIVRLFWRRSVRQAAEAAD